MAFRNPSQPGFLVLLKNGYGQGALARWRTLHEVTCVARFIARHGEAVAEQYLLHDMVESWRATREYERCAPALGYEPLRRSDRRIQRPSVECSPGGRPVLAGIEAGPRDVEHPAEHRDRVACPLRADEAVHRRYLRPVSVAKKAAVAVA